MSFIGNLIWFVFGGFWQGLSWYFVGIICCITIIGIPIGLQCFKIGALVCFPFGKDIEMDNDIDPLNIIVNVLWIIFCGIPLSLIALFNGFAFCVTIIGIPFGIQCFKIAKLALMPFGTRVVKH